MIIQIDFKAESDSGSIEGRFKVECDTREVAKEWLVAEMEFYKMRLLSGTCFSMVPDDYLDQKYLKGIIKI